MKCSLMEMIYIYNRVDGEKKNRSEAPLEELPGRTVENIIILYGYNVEGLLSLLLLFVVAIVLL